METIEQPEIVVSMIRWMRYDDIIALSTILPIVREILLDRHLMIELIRYKLVSVREEAILYRYRLDQLHRVFLRYQSIRQGVYSVGSELFVSVHKVIRYAHINKLHRMKRHLDDIVYDPVSICRASAFSGEMISSGYRCIHLSGDNRRLYTECVVGSAIGAIEGDHYTLLTRLVDLLSITSRGLDDILKRLIKRCTRWCRLSMLEYILYHFDKDTTEEHPTKVWNNYLFYYGSQHLMTSDIVKVDITPSLAQKAPYLDMLRRIYLNDLGVDLSKTPWAGISCVPLGISKSTQMIDRLLGEVYNGSPVYPIDEVWSYLLSSLDGTQSSLELLRYVNYAPPGWVDVRRNPDIHKAMEQTVEYVTSLPMKPVDKLRMLISLGVTDIHRLSGLIDATPDELLMGGEWGHLFFLPSGPEWIDVVGYIVDKTHRETHVSHADVELAVHGNTLYSSTSGSMMYRAHIEEDIDIESSFKYSIGTKYIPSLRWMIEDIQSYIDMDPREEYETHLLLSIVGKMGIHRDSTVEVGGQGV